MFKALEITVYVLYCLSLTVIVVYSVGQLHLLISYWRNARKDRNPQPPLKGNENLPFVTIQLPIYNELYVVERLLDSMAALDYPADRFEVQVLDDSTDETVEVTAKKVAELQAKGIQAIHVRREDRSGFKAGALSYGLQFAKGEFVAIFDADFLPKPDFLRATLSNFTHEGIGVVQARWEHINQNYSVFTEAQAFHLDAHFTIEQFSRDKGGFYMNFNGTAGVWRKKCIEEAGGWEGDTLTEDLDLSYRAQLKGWKFVYVDEIGAPAELPVEMSAIKSQQFRWMKGGAEVARKMFSRIMRADIPFMHKVHAFMHLTSSTVFIFVLMLGASSVPLLYIKHKLEGGQIEFLLVPVSILLGSFIVLCLMYLTTCYRREGTVLKAAKRFILNFVPFLSLSMGLALHNSIAVIQGWSGKKSPFVRTPKFALKNKRDSWNKGKYLPSKVKASVYVELLLMIYFLGGVGMSIYFEDYSILPFFLMQMAGYGAVSLLSFRNALSRA